MLNIQSKNYILLHKKVQHQALTHHSSLIIHNFSVLSIMFDPS